MRIQSLGVGLAGVLLYGAFGCGGGSGGGRPFRFPPGEGHAGAERAEGSDAARGDAAAELLEEARGRLRSGGASPRPELAWSGVVVDGQVLALELPVEAGRCLGVLVLGTRGVRDVDARLYAPDGSVLAVDEEPDPRPVVATCRVPVGVRSLYVRTHVFQGVGTVLVLPFTLAPDRMEAFARAMGMGPGLVAGREAERFDALREALRQRGYEAIGGARGVTVAAGLETRVPIGMRAGSCYAVLLAAERATEGLEAEVLDAWGSPLAKGEPEGEVLASQWCARRDERGALRVRLARGRAKLFVHLFVSESVRAGGEEGAWLGRRAGEVASGLDERSLRLRLERVRSSLSGGHWRLLPPRRLRGWEAWRPPAAERRGPKVGCELWVALGGGGIGRLQWHEGLMSWGRAAWAQRPAEAYLWRCAGRPQRGAGPLLVAEGTGGSLLVARWREAPPAHGEGLERLVLRRLRLAGVRGAPISSEVLRGTSAREGASRDGCVHGAAWSVSGAPVRLEARRPDGTLAASARGSLPFLSACARPDGSVLRWRVQSEGARANDEALHLWLGAR